MDNLRVDLENKHCKCCLRNGDQLKNLWSEYHSLGEREIYGGMITQCFGLDWEPPEESSAEQHICDACIQRLRDAYSFKQQILFSEQLLSSAEEGVKVIIEFNESEQYLESDCNNLEEYSIKQENHDDGSLNDDERLDDDNTDDGSSYWHNKEFENVEYLEEEMDLSQSHQDSDDPDYIVERSQTPKRLTTVNKHKKKKSKREVYRQYTEEQLRQSVEAVLEGMPIGEASALFSVPKSTINKKVAFVEKKMDDTGKPIPLDIAIADRPQQKFIDDIRTVLTYTNATPFKSMRHSQYACAYCYEDTFSTMWESIKVHTRTKHASDRLDVHLILRPYFANEVIKVDISDFQCVVCPAKLDSWNGMFIHLKNEHDVELDDAYTKIIPFVLTDYNCALCNVQMGNHMQLDSHMNAHYNNYMCEECGETFLSEMRLKNHLQIHSTGTFPCPQCGKVFALDRYMRKHIKYVHTGKAYPCRYCEEAFPGDYQRHLHAMEKHKESIKYTQCELCEKKFHWRPYYYKHMRFKHKRNLTDPHCVRGEISGQ